LYENFVKIIEKDQSKDYILPNKDYANRAHMKNTGIDKGESINQGSEATLCEIQRNTVESEMRKE
jgi:hypothetical protein